MAVHAPISMMACETGRGGALLHSINGTASVEPTTRVRNRWKPAARPGARGQPLTIYNNITLLRFPRPMSTPLLIACNVPKFSLWFNIHLDIH